VSCLPHFPPLTLCIRFSHWFTPFFFSCSSISRLLFLARVIAGALVVDSLSCLCLGLFAHLFLCVAVFARASFLCARYFLVCVSSTQPNHHRHRADFFLASCRPYSYCTSILPLSILLSKKGAHCVTLPTGARGGGGFVGTRRRRGFSPSCRDMVTTKPGKFPQFLDFPELRCAATRENFEQRQRCNSCPRMSQKTRCAWVGKGVVRSLGPPPSPSLGGGRFRHAKIQFRWPRRRAWACGGEAHCSEAAVRYSGSIVLKASILNLDLLTSIRFQVFFRKTLLP